MKIVVALGVIILAGLLEQGRAQAQTIVGSKHDFSSQSWSGGEVCIVCHTPHNSGGNLIPLWNHAITLTGYSFTLYSSSSLDATMTQPSGVSRACLSCHDGTVAVDQFGFTPIPGSVYVTGDALIGADLSNDHPVSFTYDAALATTDGDLHDPATTNSGLGGTIEGDLLVNGMVECSSCHEPHQAYAWNDFLIKSNDGSALCLTCHDK